MQILSLVDVEALLVGLVGYGVLLVRSNHHHVAVHVVEHHILQGGDQGLGVHQVEKDQLVVYHLDAHVSFDEENEATHLDLVIDDPAGLLGIVVPFLSEK
jgi:hypothetical protein